MADDFTKLVFMSSHISGRNLRNGCHIICKSMNLPICCSLACEDAAFFRIIEV
jgi:hypothetical protein